MGDYWEPPLYSFLFITQLLKYFVIEIFCHQKKKKKVDI